MHPINNRTKVDEKNGTVFFCNICSMYKKIDDISTCTIYCSTCKKYVLKVDFLVLSAFEKRELKKQSNILLPYYKKSLKSNVFKNRYKKEYKRVDVSESYIDLIPVPESHELINVLVLASRVIGCSMEELIKVIDNSDSDQMNNEDMLRKLIELWVFPLYFARHKMEVSEKTGSVDI